MGFIGIMWDSVEWINMAQDMENWETFVGTLLNLIENCPFRSFFRSMYLVHWTNQFHNFDYTYISSLSCS